MYIWFARRSSVAVWMNRALLVLAVVVMISQLVSKTALAQETEQQPSTPQKQTLSLPASGSSGWLDDCRDWCWHSLDNDDCV